MLDPVSSLLRNHPRILVLILGYLWVNLTHLWGGFLSPIEMSRCTQVRYLVIQNISHNLPTCERRERPPPERNRYGRHASMPESGKRRSDTLT